MSSNNLSDLICPISDYTWDHKKSIGNGGNGYVFKGKRNRDNVIVAIKILNEHELFRNFDGKRQFIREITLLHNNVHPFCLKLINFCIDTPAIITPFMEQGSLDAFLDPTLKNYTPLTPTQKMCTLYSICSTMDAIHSIGIIHRDFKPSNVFMKKNEEYFDSYIADFGSARMVGNNIKLTECPYGTPHHQAPESFFTDDYDQSVDVYSFGVSYLQYFKYNAIDKYDNGDKVIRNAYKIALSIKEGRRYKKPDNMSKKQYDIYLKCTDLNITKRPTFEQLAEIFENDTTIWFEDVDDKKYREYIEICKNICQEYKKNHNQIPDLSPQSSNASLNLSRSARNRLSGRSSSLSATTSSEQLSPTSSTSPSSRCKTHKYSKGFPDE